MSVYEKNFTTLTANEVLALQADIMSADTNPSTNSYIGSINKNGTPTKRYALTKTQYTTLGPSINAIAVDMENLKTYLNSSLDQMYGIIGNVSSDITLKPKLDAYESGTYTSEEKNIIEILLDTIKRIEETEKKIIEISNGAPGSSTVPDNLEERLKRIENLAADDYEDRIIYSHDMGNTFKLTHIPIGKVRLYINGARYFKDTYTFDKETNTLTWIATEANDGFDIEKNDVLLFEYDYDSVYEELITKTENQNTIELNNNPSGADENIAITVKSKTPVIDVELMYYGDGVNAEFPVIDNIDTYNLNLSLE